MFGKILMHWLPTTTIILKMLCLKGQFENLAEIYIILLFTNTYYVLNNKSMLITNLWYMFIQRLHIGHNFFFDVVHILHKLWKI